MNKSMKLFGWISSALVAAMLTGCATNKDDLFPHEGTTMQDIWQQSGNGMQRDLMDARSLLRRDVGDTPVVNQSSYTRTAANEIYSQFHRLPNPDLVMYVFPHLAGSEGSPVPGYSTVFPLYNKVVYAMPGERLEDY